MSRTPTIEELWQSLGAAGPTVLHRRVDDTHPLEVYAEFEPPDRPGLLLLCPGRPPTARQLRTMEISSGLRQDGRWWLRLSLTQPALRPVFAGLCRDLVASTRHGVDSAAAAAAVLARLERWRSLLEGERDALSETALRGLIGELVVLERVMNEVLPPLAAVEAWLGPLGSPQDFVLPSGRRIEVKAVTPEAGSVRINGLAQLDAGSGELILAVVRLARAGSEAAESVTAPRLVRRLRDRLAAEPLALNEFDSRLAAAGWRDHESHDRTVVRVAVVEEHLVGPGFPRLVRGTVPAGVLDADYEIVLATPGSSLARQSNAI